MRINSINYNYHVNNQNFKGIQVLNKEDEAAVDKLLGGKREIYNAITDAKDIDIFLFGHAQNEKGKMVPMYAGIVQYKKERRSSNGKMQAFGTFKCPMTEKGLKDAKEKVERSVIWANAPANLIASAAAEGLAKTDEDKEYVKKLQDKMIKAKCDNESIVWKEKIGIILGEEVK